MPILKFGEKLSSVYLEKFAPAENVPTRISVLTLQSIGIEAHWLDYPAGGIKGLYKCCGGVCCQAFGARSQSYHTPVWVYKNPKESTAGELMDWNLTKSVYQQLCDLASRYDLLKFDLEVTRVKQGQGTKTSFTVVPGFDAAHNGMRDYMSAEQKQEIENSVRMFYQVGESTLAQDCSENEYGNMLVQLGYDFNNHCFPQIAAPQYASRAAMQGVVQRPTAMQPQIAAPLPSAAPQIAAPMSQVPSANTMATPVAPVAAPVVPPVSPTIVNSAPSIPPTPAAPVAPQVPTNQPTGSAMELTAEEIDSMFDEV